MRRVFPCAALACALLPLVASAQVRSFPYEAAVETDGVPVHSGPGGKFYETGRLKRGERIVVHRHDPGGWYMIAPPVDAYSLIKADEVRSIGDGIAEVTADEASVRVGSRLSDRHDVEQVPLARGDRVQYASGVAAPNGWLAIRPPRGEYRWVPGQYVVPVPESARAQHDADPFAVPSVAKRPDTFEPPAATESAPAAKGPQLTLGPPEARPKGPGSVSAADALRMLDRELEGLALAEPTDWPLDALSAEYRRLREANPSAGRQIDVRLAQIERMQTVKRHYTEYVQLTSATDQRDASLMAKQMETTASAMIARAVEPTPESLQGSAAPPMPLPGSPEAATPLPPAAPPAEPNPAIRGGPPYATAGVVNASQPRPAAPVAVTPDSGGPFLAPPSAELAAAPRPEPPTPQAMTPPQGARPQSPAPGSPQRFDAVGVIQKAVDPHPEAPKHVLVAPNGRILVYLREQPGVPLDQFVGRPMGVDGPRHRHPELKTPMIVVERLTPVRF